MQACEFFDHLWTDYVAMAPQANVIRNAFLAKGERVVNDHVAFRTLALEPIGLARLEPHILALGYEPFSPYSFPGKKLRAFGYVHRDPLLPRVFLSELLVDELSPASAAILRKCAAQVPAQRVTTSDVMWSGRLWAPIDFGDYQTLVAESEYAAWVATLGIRPNHFTIAINNLTQHPEVEDVLRVVEGLGYAINASGGRVKGTPADLLEQGNTLADEMPVDFADGQQRPVPTCYYEFAKRHPTPSGELFQGFVAASADRIFESTDTRGPKS